MKMNYKPVISFVFINVTTHISVDPELDALGDEMFQETDEIPAYLNEPTEVSGDLLPNVPSIAAGEGQVRSGRFTLLPSD